MARSLGIPTAEAQSDTAVRTIGIGDVRVALRKGVDDFLAIPTQLVFLAVLYPLVGLIAARVAWSGPLLPLFFPLIAGLPLVGPVAAVGLYEISRRRERGEPVSWLNAFDVLKSPALLQIAGFGLLLAAIFMAWLFLAQAIYGMTVGPLAPASMGTLLREVFDTRQGIVLLVIGNLVGGVLAVLVLAISVVSVPMLLERQVSVPTAIATSIRACLRNPGPMLLWGALVAAGLILGALPAFIGLAVTIPILGHATWHLYRQLVP